MFLFIRFLFPTQTFPITALESSQIGQNAMVLIFARYSRA